jgi:alkylation response protein AidB-like acyl-CoA dehydrogenase
MSFFQLSPEQTAVQEAARQFAQNVLLPGVIERDAHQQFPEKEIQQLGELGFMGMMTDPKWGGSGMDALSYVLAIEEISKIDASTSVCMSVNNSLVCWALETFGNEEQKAKYLAPLASGQKIGAFCLSEPEAGSDATSQKTKAEEAPNGYIVNGVKNWITNGKNASIYLVFAQTHPEKKHKGINCLILERGMPGFEVGKKEDKMGIRASDTHSLLFTNVEVPIANRLGADGDGFQIAMKTLNGGRIGIAAQALGIAAGAYELALKYSMERKSFGTEIFNHQIIQFKLADMATRIEASRLLVYRAAALKDAGLDYTKESAMAKVHASETAMWVSTEAVQIHGGYGYVKEFHVERLMRDAKITQIYEGTSEIQRLVISRALLNSKG